MAVSQLTFPSNPVNQSTVFATKLEIMRAWQLGISVRLPKVSLTGILKLHQELFGNPYTIRFEGNHIIGYGNDRQLFAFSLCQDLLYTPLVGKLGICPDCP